MFKTISKCNHSSGYNTSGDSKCLQFKKRNVFPKGPVNQKASFFPVSISLKIFVAKSMRVHFIF